jgi:hypothetical protein
MPCSRWLIIQVPAFAIVNTKWKKLPNYTKFFLNKIFLTIAKSFTKLLLVLG